MEKKRKDHKLACVTTTQEPETNELLSKENQNQQNATAAAKNTKNGSPSNDNALSENQQFPSIVQWPFTPQNAVEQSQLTSRPSIPTQSSSPIIVNRWHFSQQQQNQTNHPVQQGQLPTNYAQATPPLWLPHRPSHPMPGVNAPSTFPPFTPLGMTEISWQAPAVAGGTASTNQPQGPNFCYPTGYTYPGFPGPCDPLCWWSQAQQSQPICTYAFPGAYNYFPTPPIMVPSCSASLGHSSQRGIIKPPAKLSQKHQLLWDAQSAENVQLWNVINDLQSEITDYKNRLSRLEAEVSSLKPTGEEPNALVIRTTLAKQPSKRGRPKRSVPSVDELPSPDESHPRARGRKPVPSKVQSETKALVFEKVILNKVEEKGKTSNATATMEQGNGQKASSIAAHAGGNMEINGNNLMMPAYHNQIYGIGLSSSSEMKSTDDKTGNSRNAHSIISPQTKEMCKGNSAAYMGSNGNDNLGWPANMTSEESRRNMLSIGSQCFYNNGSIIKQGGKIIPGWSFVNEEDASEELEDAVLGSTKDEDEDMGDNASSGAEEIAGTKDEGAYNIDVALRTSPKGLLPPHDNW
ncbi:uncharacterized protein LOC107424980 [Ziziphus jujuba]|uniref:Uncharacterized protein LOC107424980 n=2 Tax=Ziziphus jujuba TaxID=326968 RepID=A0A6P6GCZ5_ZIZJJ|nr:uncharacterized protein LOC107424980 [Ziziphus jujuba]KAH7520362.1 hypothetical protein FEM48_Zijuj08G0135900 [Ziziphus jujuba var. spinosa]